MARGDWDWMAHEELKAFKRAFSGAPFGPDEHVTVIQAHKLDRQEHVDLMHDLAFTELAEVIAEEVFVTIERERRVVKDDLVLAVTKVLALSRWRHVRKGEH